MNKLQSHWLQIFKLNQIERFESAKWFVIYTSSTVPLPSNCQSPHGPHLNVLCGPQLKCKPYALHHDMMARLENAHELGKAYISQNQQGILAFLWDFLIGVLYLESVWCFVNLVHKCTVGLDMHDHIW